MPTYEYQCKKCGHNFEVMQRITEEPLKRCPRCSGKLTRLLSPAPFILKGSGWYLTDYARKGNKNPKLSQDNPSSSCTPDKEKKPPKPSK